MSDPHAAAEWTDPADSPAASYSVDMAEELDTLGDRWAEGAHRAVTAALRCILSTREAQIVSIAAQRCAAAHSVMLNGAVEQLHARLIMKLAAYFLKGGNTKIRAMGLAYAAGLEVLEGASMASRAAALGLGRAGVSKAARAACRELNLPSSRYLKSDKSIEVYRQKTITQHYPNRHKTHEQTPAIQKDRNPSGTKPRQADRNRPDVRQGHHV